MKKIYDAPQTELYILMPEDAQLAKLSGGGLNQVKEDSNYGTDWWGTETPIEVDNENGNDFNPTNSSHIWD